MCVSLLAVQAQAFLQLWLFSEGEVRLTGMRWLTATTRNAFVTVFRLPEAQRADHARRLLRTDAVDVEWSRSRPPMDGRADDAAIAARLQVNLRAALGADARAIEVTMVPINYLFPMPRVRFALYPEDLSRRLGHDPMRDDEPELLVPASIRVAIQGPDGTWLSIKPVGMVDTGVLSALPVLPLLAGGLIMAGFSVLTARRIVAPLDRLVSAADRVGKSREVVTIQPDGLGEFAGVARAFEDMQRRLLRLIDDRTQMLAAISHDLRSGLTRLRIAAEVRDGAGGDPAMLAEIEEMQAMVDSTLAFASGEARMTPDRATDVAALLITLVDTATDAGKTCTYDGPDHEEIIANPVSLKRAFWNVIDNAIKYGGSAAVTLEVGDSSVKVFVADRGPGIASDQIDRAFEPFSRLDPARGAEVPGAGLGLTIARDVVHSHGGSIDLGRAVDGGLRVVFELPRLRPEQGPLIPSS